METDSIHLTIVSPEKTLFDGMVRYVRFPGSNGLFEVRANHAPIISSLDQGRVVFRNEQGRTEVDIKSGFVEVNRNEVSACVTEIETPETASPRDSGERQGKNEEK